MTEYGVQATLLDRAARDTGVVAAVHVTLRERLAEKGVADVHFETERHFYPLGLSCCYIARNQPHTNISGWGDAND